MGTRQSRSADEIESGKMRQDQERISDLTKYLSIKSHPSKSLATTVRHDEQHEADIQNVQMLRGIFKKLDPTVMKSMDDVRGAVQLSFKYEAERELLLLKVIKCRDLLLKGVRSHTSDPYIRIEMYPDPSGQGEKKTKVVHDNTNPRFDEIFHFSINGVEMANSLLLVQVWDSDILGSDDFMGEVIIKMNSFNFRDNPIHTAWYNLNNETDLSISGDLEVSMDYQLPKTLLVTVHKATDLVTRDLDRHADPFVKLTIPGLAVVHQSKVKKNTANPIWEETFEFPVALEELEERYLVLHVMDYALTSNDSLGQVMIDLKDFDPNEGFHSTIQLADLKNSDRLRNKWSRWAMSQEFQESLTAHAISKHPLMLFQQHKGRKVINVSCRKAGAQGKIRIIDGIPVF